MPGQRGNGAKIKRIQGLKLGHILDQILKGPKQPEKRDKGTSLLGRRKRGGGSKKTLLVGSKTDTILRKEKCRRRPGGVKRSKYSGLIWTKTNCRKDSLRKKFQGHGEGNEAK